MQREIEALAQTCKFSDEVASEREGYARIKEAVELVFENTEGLPKELERFWRYVRQNPDNLAPEYQTTRKDMMRGVLYNMMRASLKAAEEAIWLAATCERVMEELENASTDSD